MWRFPRNPKNRNYYTYLQKDALLSYNNYWPISLLSNISKIIEKIVQKRLLFILENNNYLHELQFGFRNKTSTSQALFLIHFNELHKTIINSNVYHFVDDTNLLLIDTNKPKLKSYFLKLRPKM